ncbi:MAG: DUF4340 domain-containing protein [Acidobacteria bacterium]|nr:DUF4340 domain-containing protein [Acidobacteriota bacterium]
MRGLLSTVALVLVLAGLGAYIYFVDSKRPDGGVEAKPKVFSVERDAIEEVTVTADGETSTIRKTDGVWKMTSPITGAADDTEANGLTSAIASLEINRVVDESAANLAEYGLAEPRIAIAFKGANGAGGEIHLGQQTPTKSDLYAVKPGEKRVFLVQAFQETALAKKSFDLRDKRVLHFERDKVDTIDIVQPGALGIQLSRSGSDWVVKQPIQTRGDYSVIEGLLTRLAGASMTKLVDTSGPQTFGLDKPSAVITVGAGSARAALEFGAEEDGAVYVRDPARQAIFAVDPTLGADAKKPVEDYRDKDLFEFRNFNASRVKIVRGADTYEFQKIAATAANTADKWQRVVAGGSATDLDLTKMEDLLTKLTSLRAQSFKAANGTGIDKPTVVISASYDGDKFEQVQVARGSPDVVASRNGEPGVAVLDTTSFDDMMTALNSIVTPAPTAP